MRGLLAIVFAIAAVVATPAQASEKGWACWNEAATRYNIDVALLYAVARVETGARTGVVARNTDGSYDIGVMQINSWWLPKLAKVGITAHMLRDNACLNVKVGAWILAQSIKDYGLNWRGVGAYNARSDSKRAIYARKVATELRKVRAEYAAAQPSTDSVASVGGGS